MNKIFEKTKTIWNITKEKVSKFNDFFLMHFHKHDTIIYIAIVTILSLLVRLYLFPNVKGDYTSFLKNWYLTYLNEGVSALGKKIGDYTPCYNYLLYFLSLFKLQPENTFTLFSQQCDPVLFGIKTISTVFDYGMAVYAYFIGKEFFKDKLKPIFIYALTIFGLTVVLNSAMWGQCDSIYVFFITGSIYYLIKSKQQPVLSTFMLSMAFCFKLQTVFVLPVFLILYLKKQYKLHYLLLVPVVYVVAGLPACFAAGSNFGDRFSSMISTYFNQLGSYTQVTLNAGTFYALIFTNFKDETFISSLAIFLTLFINGTLIFIFQRFKKPFSGKTIFKLFVLFAMTMPYFMPHMHERYFYLSDIIIVIYAFINFKKFYVAILAILNSMIGYMVYLWNVPFIPVVPVDGSITDYTKAASFRFGAAVFLVSIIIVFKDLFKELSDEDKLIDKPLEQEIQNLN